MPITAKIPVNKRSGSLYIFGRVTQKFYAPGKGSLIRLQGVAAAFYSYSNYRRAYVICEPNLLQPILQKAPLFTPYIGTIPLVKESVGILYFAEGKRFDLLKFTCKNIEDLYAKRPFLYSPLYWIKLTAMIDAIYMKKNTGKRTKRNIQLLTETYQKERDRLNEDY